VPGDLVRIDTGAIVPADIRLLRTDALECDESVLTGESLPVEKSSAPVTAGTGLNDLTCCALMGTLVRAGEGEGVVVGTGGSTEFGRIALSLGAVAISAIAVVVVGAILPMSPLADDLGFARLPAGFFAALVGMVIAYLTLAEVAKREFYRRLERPLREAGRREQRRIQRRAARFSRRGALSR
jgi:magnesium-transporting ATPase (P-type)